MKYFSYSVVLKIKSEKNSKMKYLIAIVILCISSTLGLEFDRPCRDDVAAKENFSPAFVSLVKLFKKMLRHKKSNILK